MHDTTLNRESTELSYQPTGISPQILVTQVKNTVPFIFATASEHTPAYIRNLIKSDALIESGKGPELHQDPFRYYELCLSAHHATVASFVPTDVDNHIRHKLWVKPYEAPTLIQLRDLIVASLAWDCRVVSTRFVQTPKHGALSGHHGEWFSTAVGAYGALKKHPGLTNESEQFTSIIIAEINRQFAMYASFRSAGDNIAILKTATIIAHNLGDLNRVIDMWGFSEDDYLRRAIAHCFLANQGRWQKANDELQNLNRDLMAAENHRHFALRKPRALRRSAEYLLPIGPFFDNWGAKLATSKDLTYKELAEIVEALIDGWHRLDGPVGYARALAGITEHIPGGISELASLLPARIFKTMQAGRLRQLMSVSKERFEAQWQNLAMKALKNAPPSL